MKTITTVQQMHTIADEIRKDRKIGFVPTMGYLHEGHLTLVRKARELADVVVVSIFVNPMQFGPKEDLTKYPRDFDRDATLLEKETTDYIFYPDTSEMYPERYSTQVEVCNLQDNLCGKSRPDHFVGVATVVAKLFNIVKPHYAVFGMKDYQQLKVIERMVRDLNMDLTIVPYPTVREKDGLAMSSRNTYLSADERTRALSISKSLVKAQELVSKGEHSTAALKNAVQEILAAPGGIEIDYIDITDSETLGDIETIKGKALLAIACRVGKTRLIDNCVLTEA